jgi:microcystin-dependent protein
MAEPYLGEIRLGGWNFAPVGWALCDGSTLSIAQNDALFALVGTTYGGNGETTFSLPNLLGRVPVHQGSSYLMGQTAGAETVTLTTAQLPEHQHTLKVSSAEATTGMPTSNFPATAPLALGYAYSSQTSNTTMGAVIEAVGGSQPHSNLQPFLCITYVIALQGIFPSQG